ncbi:hypothetical protein X975_21410, partial [Stegodyphus mimosarum]
MMGPLASGEVDSKITPAGLLLSVPGSLVRTMARNPSGPAVYSTTRLRPSTSVSVYEPWTFPVPSPVS